MKKKRAAIFRRVRPGGGGGGVQGRNGKLGEDSPMGCGRERAGVIGEKGIDRGGCSYCGGARNLWH